MPEAAAEIALLAGACVLTAFAMLLGFEALMNRRGR